MILIEVGIEKGKDFFRECFGFVVNG